MPSISSPSLIPSGKRVNTEAVSVNLYYSRIYLFPSFFLHFPLLLLSRFSILSFYFLHFIPFSSLYSNSLSHTRFFLPFSLSVFPFHFHHALSQPCTASADHPRPHFLHLVTDAQCTAGACIIVCDFGCAFSYMSTCIGAHRESVEREAVGMYTTRAE